jgi:hypothetical protein
VNRPPETHHATSGDVRIASGVVLTRTVQDLTAGSGIAFEVRGAHDLLGVPDDWELYAAADS